MAVDSPVLYNDVWVGLRHATVGPNYGSVSDEQTHNARRIYHFLRVLGYTANSACAILGNMQVESGISPACLENNAAHLAQLPNNGEHLADLTNAVMLQWHDPVDPQHVKNYGTGLIQWDGYTTTAPAGNTITSFAMRYDWLWYDWYTQILRLEAEYLLDPWGWGGINGQTTRFWYYLDNGQYANYITWANFKTSTDTPEYLAEAFRAHRERSGANPSGIQHRKDNARYWYNQLSNASVDYQLESNFTAGYAYIFRNSGYQYQQVVHGITVDCLGYVNLVRTCMGLDIIGNHQGHFGTNSLWRNTTGELYWRGTVQQCIDEFGEIPRGSYLFKCYPEGSPGYNTIPDYYRNDGVGNFAHIGIYTGHGLGVMQSGGYDAGRNGVADCAFHPTQTDPQLAYDWWTHVAFARGIYFYTYAPSPYRSARTVVYFLQNKKQLKKAVIR